MISCPVCSLQTILEHANNFDEVYLNFLVLYDANKIPSAKILQKKLQTQQFTRNRSEIKNMIGSKQIDETTSSILYSQMDYICHYAIIKTPEPQVGCNVDDIGLDDDIVKYLHSKNIFQFYKFQERAIQEIMHNNSNVIIEAPTASGKTEAFTIPILQKIKNESSFNDNDKHSNVIAIFVYPTKALAHDQYPKILQLAEKVGITIDVFDGDTSMSQRAKILDNDYNQHNTHSPRIIITNFDILHYHMWHKTKFASLLSTIKFLVVDEVHTYSGIFGSNVHYIIKRLKRISKNNIQIIAASATLDNATSFCNDLFQAKMKLVQGTGRPGQTDFIMIFPSLRTQRELIVDLVQKLTRAKHKTLIFSNSHLGSELLTIQARKQGINIMTHRAGLTPKYRNYVEKAFKENKLDVISCTPTLELGIDIGDVDGVISSTIPITRLLQRIGRAARQGQNGYALVTLGNDPISQYYKNHPRDYFEDTEKIYIDPKNPFVQEYQILAMAHDKPLSYHELKEYQDIIKKHIQNQNLKKVNGRYTPNITKTNSVLSNYSIRGMGSTIDIFLGSKKVGDRILPIALEELYPEAIYFLAGKRYRVVTFNYPKQQFAKLEKISHDYPYYTKALKQEWPTIKTTYEKRDADGIEIAHCQLEIKKQVYGYVNIEIGKSLTQGQKILLEKPLEYNFVTKGIVFCAPSPDSAMLHDTPQQEYIQASGYHATEHVIIEGSNMITGGVSQDLGGISLGTSGLIFVYDGAIGGSGASKALYDRFEKAAKRGLNIVKECPCTSKSGCPRCTYSYRCGNNNEYLHKQASLEIFQKIVDGDKTVITEPDSTQKPLV